ncbi:MAG TPA: inositol monophosphatase family protein [Anaerolineae bacterium]
MNHTPSLLSTAVQGARAAGAVALDRFHTPVTISEKGFRDIVTEVDVLAQDAAVAAIRARFPDAAILGEENLQPPPDAETLWIVDPIDGTTNYARHFPCFSVSIGVVERERPIIGVIYDPLRDHLFTAERGRGAHWNGSPIRVSTVNRLQDAILALDWGRSADVRDQSLALLYSIAAECRSVRAIGSAALGMCYLAAGWVDLWFNLALKPWDGAAGQVIVEEAGGRITTPDREAWNYTRPGALASNGLLHSAFDRCSVRANA